MKALLVALSVSIASCAAGGNGFACAIGQARAQSCVERQVMDAATGQAVAERHCTQVEGAAISDAMSYMLTRLSGIFSWGG